MEARDIDLPPFPRQYAMYLRMRVTNLLPNELWETAIEDVETALEVQAAWNAGVEDAQDDCKARNAS